MANDRFISSVVREGNLEALEEILGTSGLCPWSVEGLLESHAKTTDFTYSKDETVLHLASIHDRGKVIETLLKYGADIDARTTSGETALHISSERGCANAVKTLLDYGSDINVTCNCGKTPLYYRSNIANTECLVQLFRLHVIKMQAANRRVSEENLLNIGINGDTIFLRNDCENEIESMRNEKIYSNVSFYDILTEDINKLATYARMKNVKALKSDCYKRKFPIYSGWIDTGLRRGQHRQDLLDRAANSFNSMIHYKLIQVLTVEICSYASNDELKNLITASETAVIKFDALSLTSGRAKEAKRKL